ncbi:helix-turn-helix domain-containing protein [Helicobacter suis]
MQINKGFKYRLFPTKRQRAYSSTIFHLQPSL